MHLRGIISLCLHGCGTVSVIYRSGCIIPHLNFQKVLDPDPDLDPEVQNAKISEKNLKASLNFVSLYTILYADKVLFFLKSFCFFLMLGHILPKTIILVIQSSFSNRYFFTFCTFFVDILILFVEKTANK
jgi:hypothetical protein